jgi:MFS family permease
MVYTALFALAGMCRLLSTLFLYLKSEPEPEKRDIRSPKWSELATIWRRGQAGPLLGYLWLMYATAQIAGPFFTPYLLNDMECSYSAYMVIVGISIAAKAICMPFAGRIAQRFGARQLLIWSGLVIIPLPVFWLFSRELWYLLMLQFLAGVSWGAFELAIVLIFLEAIPLQKRTSILTLYNLGFAVANVTGSLVGGLLLTSFGANSMTYYGIFALSGIARLLTLPLVKFLPESSPNETLSAVQIESHLIAKASASPGVPHEAIAGPNLNVRVALKD